VRLPILAVSVFAAVVVLALGAWSYRGDQRMIADLRQSNQSSANQLKQANDLLHQTEDRATAAEAKSQNLAQQVTDASKLADDTQKKLDDAQARASAAEEANQGLTKQAADAKTLADDAQKKLGDAQATNKMQSQKMNEAQLRIQILNDLLQLATDKQTGKDVTQESVTWVAEIGKLNDPKLNKIVAAITNNPQDKSASSDMIYYLLQSAADNLK
jgi:chromosome segregation ATPase